MASEQLTREELLFWGEMLAADCAGCHVLDSEPGARHVGIPRITGIPRRELFKTIGACLTNPRNMTLTDYGQDLRRRERAGEIAPGHGLMMTQDEVNALMTFLENQPQR